MLKIILIAGLLGVAGFLVYVYQQPADFKISRSLHMAAPTAKPFAQVNDFHAWKAWSPWEKMDPTAKSSYAGPAAGPGASYTWAGNNKVGEGKMTITDTRPNELVRIRLDFLKPMAATNTAEFTFQPDNSGTNVTWSMFGKNTFPQRLICTFMNMDKMVGTQFEKGLAEMKTIVESNKP